MRIGQDLHDRLGSMLATIKLFFHLPNDQQALLSERQLERYQIATKLLDDSYQEVRKIAHNMVSNLLMKFGLVEALKEFEQTINSSNQVKMVVTCHNMNERLESTIEVTLFRIIQEVVTNALNHAQATEINVSLLNQDQESLHLLIEDNGIGFDPNMVSNGIGMQILKARVLQLRGTLEYDTGQGHGTTVTLDLPLHPTAVEQLHEPIIDQKHSDASQLAER
jgi:signal transduction histidine kinase